MTLIQTLTTIFEIAMVLLLFWGFLNEERLVAFERKIFANIRRRRLRVIHTNTNKYCPAKRVTQ